MSLQIQTGKVKRAQRNVIYGIAGVGKSTFAASFPKPLFADTEGGTDQLDVDRVDIPTWKDLLKVVRGMEKLDYQTLNIDSVDWAADLLINWMLDQDQKESIADYSYGAGHAKLTEHWSRFLSELKKVQQQGIHVNLIGHSEVKRHEMPDDSGAYDRYLLKLPKRLAPLTMEWADNVFFTNYQTKIVERDGKMKAMGGSKRLLFTERCAAFDAKNRLGLDPKLPLEFASIATHFPALHKSAVEPATVEKQPKKDEKQPQPVEKQPKEEEAPIERLLKLIRESGQPYDDVILFLEDKDRIKKGQLIHALPSDYIQRVLDKPDLFFASVREHCERVDDIPL